MSDNYEYERCLIDVAATLKKRGTDNYEETAAKMCRMRVDEVKTERSFAMDSAGDRENKRSFGPTINISIRVYVVSCKKKRSGEL